METEGYDVVFTSPSYCNRYDYTRTYALELALLGLGESEVVRLRQEMVSCTVENRRAAFAESEAHPPLFFIGAAIVRNMAGELWRGLENNTFANAANLTDDGQLAAVARWLRTL